MALPKQRPRESGPPRCRQSAAARGDGGAAAGPTQSRTDVLAPSDGLVTNLQQTTGQYAGLGQLVLAFIDIPGLLGQRRIPRDRRR